MGGGGGFSWFGLLVVFVLSLLVYVGADQRGGAVPSLFVFGDSLVDVGNNNYLPLSVDRADFPHNGVDYPGQKATGRFSNGLNAADFIAERLGIASPTPYLSLNISSSTISNNTNSILRGGVNFASGGAGILDPTLNNPKQYMPLNEQIDHYSTIYRDNLVIEHLSRSLFVVVIGSNDLIGYFSPTSSTRTKYTRRQYVDLMLTTVKAQLQRIYSLGARKLLAVGLAPIGCIPSQRSTNSTEVCNAETNFWCTKYNEGFGNVLKNMKAEENDFNYVLYNTYLRIQDYINNPSIYGFNEIKAACCGLGKLNALVPCLPAARYCSNRSDHLFWDLYHPTQIVAHEVVRSAFEGTFPYVYPYNVNQLMAM